MAKLSEEEKIKKFHLSRNIFVIKDRILHINKEKVEYSHLEWFKKLGWVKDEKDETFLMNSTVRGYFDKEGIYFFSGFEFLATFADKTVFERHAKQLMKLMKLKGDLPVYAGVIKTNKGKKYQPKEKLGSISKVFREAILEIQDANIYNGVELCEVKKGLV